MAKLTISEAVGLTGISESTIRRDIKSGKVSEEKRALMPPVDEKQQKSTNWLLRLVGAR